MISCLDNQFTAFERFLLRLCAMPGSEYAGPETNTLRKGFPARGGPFRPATAPYLLGGRAMADGAFAVLGLGSDSLAEK